MAENPRIEELRRRVQADPASIAFAALAEEFRRIGRNEDAIETCRTGLQRHPAYLSARVTLGRALIETADYDGAREELETVLRSAPENLAAIRGLATIDERLGHSSEMDPHLADLMKTHHAESIRVAALSPPPPPPPPVPPVAVQPVDIPPVVEIEEQFEPQPDVEPDAEAVPELELQPEPVVAAEPEPQLEPDVQFELDPTGVAEPVFAEDSMFLAEPEPEPEFRAQPGPEVEAAFDLSLAPPLGLTPGSDPDLGLSVLRLDLEPEPAIGAPAAPDPQMLATLARLERFLGAIESLRS